MLDKLPRGHEIEIRTIAALVHIGDPKNIRVQEAMLKLDKDCFLDANHRVLFNLILELFNKGNAFDLVEFMTIVPDEQYALITEIMRDEYVTINNLEHDVDKLLSYRLLRKQLKILHDTISLVSAKTIPEECLQIIHCQLQLLSSSNNNQTSSIVRSYETIADEFLSQTDEDNCEIYLDIPNLPPIPNRALVTIAGRSGHGKTFIALHLMDKIIDKRPGRQTLYFNLEMHEHVMMERHAKLLGVPGNTRREIITNGIGHLLRKNVSLISQPRITIEQIEAESRLASLYQPIAVIVVDYLGLITSKTKYESNHLQQNDIAKRLAALSLELDCIVIGLIQVNRDFKTRPVGERCPVPSDSADAMGSVHSASWWLGIDQPQNDDDSTEFRDLFMIACRKNRGDGGLFNLNLTFRNGMFSKWERPFCNRRDSRDGGF